MIAVFPESCTRSQSILSEFSFQPESKWLVIRIVSLFLTQQFLYKIPSTDQNLTFPLKNMKYLAAYFHMTTCRNFFFFFFFSRSGGQRMWFFMKQIFTKFCLTSGVRGTRTQPLICVGCSVHYCVSCAITAMLRHVWPVNSDNSFNAISFPEAAILLPVQVDKATRTLGTRLLSTFLVDPDAFRLVTRLIPYANFFRGTSH